MQKKTSRIPISAFRTVHGQVKATFSSGEVILRGGLLAVFVATLIASSQSANASYNTGSVDVSGKGATAPYSYSGHTYGPYAWDYSYTRSFDGTTLSNHLGIDFKFDGGFTAEQRNAYKANAEAAIEGMWNNKFVIYDGTNGSKFAISVDVTTVGPFNQTVNVFSGAGGTDMSNWYRTYTNGGNTDVAGVKAHEFGHMLGLYDEYIGGAVNQYPNPLLSPDGLMGSGTYNANPVMYERYYQQDLDYMITLNPDTHHSFQLSPVPEPSVALMLGSGLVFLAAVVRRRVGYAVVH